MHTDLIVVGSGLAAHRAALLAIEHGASVLMLEKMPSIGGSTVMSGGSFAFAGTDLQREAGIDDDADRLRRDLLAVGGGESDPALVDRYVEGQLDEYRFLLGAGAQFGPVQLSSGQSVPRSHPAHPRTVLNLLHAKLTASANATVWLGARATRLRRSNAAGPIDEVLVERGGEQSVVRARHGVILATGGFSRGEDLLKLFVPSIRGALRAGGQGNEGDGIKMAWEHGAGFADLGFVKGTFGSYLEVDPVEPHTTLLPVYRGAIAVNLSGQRFVSESKSYKTLGAACLLQPQARAYQIFDQQIIAQSVEGVPSFDFAAALRKQRIFSAPSIRELAALIGVDAVTLEQTVSDYNADARTGHDRKFGRKALAHEYGAIVPLEHGPFYAYPCTTSINSTYAGLRVRGDMAVLNVWGEALHGLYAAGEVIGGFHGEAYMTGSSLVKALVFGRIAAESALSRMETLR
jgi:fumarate reductase flavoprotein subunit